MDLKVRRWLVAAWIVAFFSGAGRLGAQQDFERAWPVSTGGFISESSPAVSGDGSRIYVGVELNNGADGQVIAVSTDGRALWVRTFPETFSASPVLSADGATLYIGCSDTRLYALNAANGTPRWSMPTGGYIHSSAAIVEQGGSSTVYVGSADGKLYAFDGATGTERWTFETDDVVWSSPAVAADGTIYVGSWDRRLYALTPQGNLKWAPFATGGRIWSSPAIGRDGTIYVGSDDQRLYAIAPDGTRKWDFLVNGEIQASPVLGADGTIYFAALDQNFYALNPDGTLKWRHDLGETNSISTAAVRGDGKIIFGADDGILRALNPHDGSLYRSFDTGTDFDPIECSPVVAPDGSIYFGSDRLYKLHGNGSPLSTFSNWPAFRRTATRTARAEQFSQSGQLVNMSIRAQVQAEQTLIVGFVVQAASDAGRVHLLRAVGPTLADFGVAGVMPDPQLRLFAGQTTFPGGANNDWETPDQPFFGREALVRTTAEVGAFTLPDGSRDAAVLVPLPAGVFSTHVTSADGRAGVALVETYDTRFGDPARLINLSARHNAGSGENVLIAGFVVGGTERTRLLLRGVGPALALFGIPGFLAQPRLELYSAPGDGGSPQLVRSPNVGWTSEGVSQDLASAAELVGAFALPAGSADCAMIVVVNPGAYTLQIAGTGGTTGEALAEIYVLP